MRKHFNLWSVQGVATVLLAALLIGVFFITPLHDYTDQAARRFGASLMWDVWHGGRIHWNGYTIQVEKGRYGWTIGDRGGLMIFPRADMNGALVDINPGDGARLDYTGMVKALCLRLKCTDIREEQNIIDGALVRSIEYVYIDEKQVERQETFMRLDALDLLIHVSSSRSAFTSEKSVALSLISQMLVQKKSLTK